MAEQALPRRMLSHTGISVTTLDYGAMSLDDRFGRIVPQAEAAAVLNAVLDAGINYIDTSPDYGPSEEMIGTTIAHRRDQYVLATKCGCPVAVDGAHAYTRENIVAAVEQSLCRLRMDYIDVVQFYGSPSLQTLHEHDAIAVLRGLQQRGLVRFIGMSGTEPHLADHIASGAFDVLQIPYSALQREHGALIGAAWRAEAGTVLLFGWRTVRHPKRSNGTSGACRKCPLSARVPSGSAPRWTICSKA